MSRMRMQYGWLPDLPDYRDHRYAAPRKVLAKLPRKVDLRAHCPPVLDQGELGACTAHAIANAHRYDQIRQKARNAFLPSRLFIYYNERVMERTVGEDAGAMIRDGIKSIAKQGACPENLWSYDIRKFTRKPPAKAYREAERHQAISYQRVERSLTQMKGCLAAGTPFVFGFSVYESFESPRVARTGNMPMPGRGERSLGGHAVLAVGYDDAKQVFTVMNSWSERWGDKGYFYMPYAYLADTNLADDLWAITIVETV